MSNTRPIQPTLAASFLLLTACGDPSIMTAPELDCLEGAAADSEQAMELYLAAWTESDPLERACLIQRSLSDDVALIDAADDLEGRFAVERHIDEALTLLRDGALTREPMGQQNVRHQEARFAWVVVDPQGNELERGEDWLEFSADGLISRVHRFSGAGVETQTPDEFLAWQDAWNTRDESARMDALRTAATEEVRFTDLLVDVQGYALLSAEISRQQELFDGELVLGDTIRTFGGTAGQPRLVRQSLHIALGDSGTIELVNYIRLRDGRIERLSGFPTEAL